MSRCSPLAADGLGTACARLRSMIRRRQSVCVEHACGIGSGCARVLRNLYVFEVMQG